MAEHTLIGSTKLQIVNYGVRGAWHIEYDGIQIFHADTKHECQEEIEDLTNKLIARRRASRG